MAAMMAVVGINATYRSRLRPWLYTWGADSDEVAAALPGDELVAAGAPRTTRALTIAAPVHTVWRWLAQVGEDRGGFYSYAMLERAVGAHVHNANRIHPEWQDLRVGDTIWLARRYGTGASQVVALVDSGSHLVLVSPRDFQRVQQGERASGSWGFHLRPIDGGTRLIARGSGGWVGHPWFDLVHFVMERRMMCGIRIRAERIPTDESAQHAVQHIGVRQLQPPVATIP